MNGCMSNLWIHQWMDGCIGEPTDRQMAEYSHLPTVQPGEMDLDSRAMKLFRAFCMGDKQRVGFEDCHLVDSSLDLREATAHRRDLSPPLPLYPSPPLPLLLRGTRLTLRPTRTRAEKRRSASRRRKRRRPSVSLSLSSSNLLILLLRRYIEFDIR
jgi:hypothetical protein